MSLPARFKNSVEKIVQIQVKDNKISRWSEVEKLAKLPSLIGIALTGNPIEKEDPTNYFDALLRLLPQVKSLD